MSKVNVPQKEGTIVFMPGGTKPTRSYEVTAGTIEVADEDLAEVLANIDGAHAQLVPQSAADKAAAKAAEDAAAKVAAEAEQAHRDNAQAVADAAAAGAARAAAELKKAAK